MAAEAALTHLTDFREKKIPTTSPLLGCSGNEYQKMITQVTVDLHLGASLMMIATAILTSCVCFICSAKRKSQQPKELPMPADPPPAPVPAAKPKSAKIKRPDDSLQRTQSTDDTLVTLNTSVANVKTAIAPIPPAVASAQREPAAKVDRSTQTSFKQTAGEHRAVAVEGASVPAVPPDETAEKKTARSPKKDADNAGGAADDKGEKHDSDSSGSVEAHTVEATVTRCQFRK